MNNDEKIKAIVEVLKKYNLSICNVKILEKEEFLQEAISTPLSTIADEYVPIINCYREIVRIMYNIHDMY